MTADARSCWPVAALLLFSLAPGCDGPPPAVSERASLVGHSREVTSIAFAPDGKTLASRGGDAVKVWELAGLREVASFPGDGSEMGSLAFSPDGSTLAATSAGKGAVAWDLASKQGELTYLHPTSPGGASAGPVNPGWGLSFSPDGKILAGGGADAVDGGFVTLWDVAGGVGVKLHQPDSLVTSLAITPDGRLLASKGLGESIVLWDLASRQKARSIGAGRSFGAPLGFSPDGKTLASADDDRRVKLWDVATGKEVASLKWHLRAVLSLSFHPVGRLLASGDSNGVILLWDLTSRSPIARFEGHQGKVWSLAFSPDGKTLASAGEDKAVRLWDVGDSTSR